MVTQYRGGDDDDTAGGVVLTAAGEVLLFGSTEDSAGNDYPTRILLQQVRSLTIRAQWINRHHLKLLHGKRYSTHNVFQFVGGTFNDYLGDTGIVQGGWSL